MIGIGYPLFGILAGRATGALHILLEVPTRCFARRSQRLSMAVFAPSHLVLGDFNNFRQCGVKTIDTADLQRSRCVAHVPLVGFPPDVREEIVSISAMMASCIFMRVWKPYCSTVQLHAISAASSNASRRVARRAAAMVRAKSTARIPGSKYALAMRCPSSSAKSLS